MSSYLIAPLSAHERKAILEGDEARHAVRVARHGIGDIVRLIDGVGTGYDARISSVGRERVECEVLRRIPSRGEPKVDVTLAAAMVKGGRFETLIEKAVEIGATTIWPIETARAVVRNPSKNKQRRWRAVAMAATKQCLRSRIPSVSEPISLSTVVERMGLFDAAFVAWEGETRETLAANEHLTGARYLVVVGPEGGFREGEVAQFRGAGARTISLGARRLRAETAAICALTLVLDRAGEFERLPPSPTDEHRPFSHSGGR